MVTDEGGVLSDIFGYFPYSIYNAQNIFDESKSKLQTFVILWLEVDVS